MDWNGNLRHFASSRPECSYGFLYNYNYDQYQGMDMKNHHGMISEAIIPQGLVVNPGMEIKTNNVNNNNNNNNNTSSYGFTSNNISIHDKKKRLSNDQLDSLEKSFQEEIKLDPDRKMKLSRDLGLQPRQIAVWFQNRRARWKAKQLERLYDSLKLEFDAVAKEKQKLQDEVMKLKAMLRDQAVLKQVSAGAYTEISGEETVESTSGAIRSSSKSQGTNKPLQNHHHLHQNMVEQSNNHNMFNNMEQDYNNVSPQPYWGPMISSYP